MRILFLDMDEVLCTAKAHQERDHLSRPLLRNAWPFRCALDPENIALLNEVCDEVPHLRTVSCSTWRHHWERDDLTDYMREHGWTGVFHDDWETPLADIRGREIQHWLDDHPDVTQYAILDDNPEAGEGHALERFVHVQHFYDGFTRGYVPLLRKALSA